MSKESHTKENLIPFGTYNPDLESNQILIFFFFFFSTSKLNTNQQEHQPINEQESFRIFFYMIFFLRYFNIKIIWIIEICIEHSLRLNADLAARVWLIKGSLVVGVQIILLVVILVFICLL